ncbi:MAG: phosphopyruvate hydratase [Candidatus Helarchaeales archaeon]
MSEIPIIKKIKSRWILDSRGNPTIESEVYIENSSIVGRAAVPSGASTGEHEAIELRDGGKEFHGKGVLKAIQNVIKEIQPRLIGVDVRDQKRIDQEMIDLDGTENKSRLGANAILSVSLAVARAAAAIKGVPLHEYLYELSHDKKSDKYLLPVPMSNVINGGKHAGGDLAIQEFMILPVGGNKFSEALQMLSETYHELKQTISKRYGHGSVNIGDEGGFAPAIQSTKDALNLLMDAISSAGYEPGKDFMIAMDAAASEFYKEGKYFTDGKSFTPEELVDFYKDLIQDYPIISLEDPFDENDFETFALLTKSVGSKCLIVGDDLFVTNVTRIRKGFEMGSANALLLKVNQIGTLSESIEACKYTFSQKGAAIVSHRSGETEDTFIADLSVGLCTGLIKTGAPCRTDRTCKYNQLLRIEESLEANARYPGIDIKNKWKEFQ